MGNIEQNQKSQITFQQQYQESTQTNRLGIILIHKQTSKRYLLREYTFSSELAFSQMHTRLQLQIKQSSQYLTKIIQVHTKTIPGLCSTTLKIYAIYQYPQVTLRDQIQARKKQGNSFQETQLWSILQVCIQALCIIKPTASLNTGSIYLTEQGEIKVINNDLLQDDYRFSPNGQYLYAPQKINNFSKIDTDTGLLQQSIFSLGMLIIQSCLLITEVQCYDFKQMKFKYGILEEYVQRISQQYSIDFSDIVGMMVQIDPKSRASFSLIKNMINNYWNSQQNCSMMSSNQKANCVYYNMPTVNSNQKQSIRSNQTHAMPFNQTIKQMQPLNKTVENKRVSGSYIQKLQKIQSLADKQNVYTDPSILAMIKKDLHQITKLKHSTLKQTIKHSFLFESDNIFASVSEHPFKNTSHNQQLQNNKHNSSSDRAIKQNTNNTKKFDYKEAISFSSFDNKNNQQAFIQDQSFKPIQNSSKWIRVINNEGWIYEGYFDEKTLTGWGRITFNQSQQSYCQGYVLNGNMQGKGILYYSKNKPLYDGDWVNGQFNGRGIFYNQNPVKIFSSFDFRNFDNAETYFIKYEGQFKQDLRCGSGRLYLSNGQWIQGIFNEDILNGEAVFHKIGGARVRGVWVNNELVKIIDVVQ